MTEAEARFAAYQERRVKENMRKYGDIIDLPHPTHEGHPSMPVEDRAAQFAAFAALTGLDDAMEDMAGIHEDRAIHDTEREGYDSD